jgi:hypothetical protein
MTLPLNLRRTTIGTVAALSLLKKIKPGQTVRVKPGQWLVEEQDEVHH